MREDITDIIDKIPKRCPGCGKIMRKHIKLIEKDGKLLKTMISQRIFTNVSFEPPIKLVVCKHACKHRLAEKLRKKYEIQKT